MMGVKMMVLRYSTKLKTVVQKVQSGPNEKNFQNPKEIDLYLAYNTIGKIFFKYGGYLAFVICLLYHLKPLEDIFKAGKVYK